MSSKVLSQPICATTVYVKPSSWFKAWIWELFCVLTICTYASCVLQQDYCCVSIYHHDKWILYSGVCHVQAIVPSEPKFLNLQWNGYNEWPVPDTHDDIMAFMDLHNGHVDLIKEIQTALTKRAKLWDHEPALVYTGQSEKSWPTLGLKSFIRDHLHSRLRALNSSVLCQFCDG